METIASRLPLARLSCSRPAGTWRHRTRLSAIGAAIVAFLALAAPLPGLAMASTDIAPLTAVAPNNSDTASFPNTDAGIHLGLAFDFLTQDATGVSRNVDYIYGGYFDDWDFGFYPPVSHNDGYVPFDEDAYPQSVPGHSLAWYQANHPDWVVYRCDGTTPAYYGTGESNVPLDFSNPEVQSYEFQQAAQLLQQGAQGVAFDNFSFTNYENRCGVYKNGVWTPLGYPGLNQDNPRLDSDMMGWLQSMRAMLSQQFPGKSLGVNMPPVLSGLRHVEQVAPYIDMEFDEAGFTDWGDGNISDSAWQTEVASLQYLNSQGKAFDVNEIVPAPDDADVTRDQLNWALANYLLVKGSHSYTYVYADDDGGSTGLSGYGTFYDRPEYHTAIGNPTSGMYQWQNVYMRNYSGGLVIVNPSGEQTVTVKLNQPYVDLYSASYTSVTLGPTSGILLLTPAVSDGTPASVRTLAATTPVGGKPSPTRMCVAPASRRHHPRRPSSGHSTPRRQGKTRNGKPSRHAGTTGCANVRQPPGRRRRPKGSGRSSSRVHELPVLVGKREVNPLVRARAIVIER
jgi:Hypothetical glycosyl hydrolase family 15